MKRGNIFYLYSFLPVIFISKDEQIESETYRSTEVDGFNGFDPNCHSDVVVFCREPNFESNVFDLRRGSYNIIGLKIVLTSMMIRFELEKNVNNLRWMVGSTTTE